MYPISDLDVPTAVASPLSPLSSLPSLILPERTVYIPPTVPDTTMLNALQTLPHLLDPTALPPIILLQGQAFPVTSPAGFLTAAKIPCYGAQVKWELGHSSKTYPFQCHNTDYPNWSVSTHHPPDIDVIHLQSFSCALFHDPSTEACFECLKLPSSDKFRSLVLKASNNPALTMPWDYLSWEQVLQRLKDKTDECRRYRKKEGSCRSSRLTRRFDDYERLIQHIANGSSPAAVISKLQLAIENKYTPHPGIDELALDLGYLVKAIGGPKLLFALNRTLALPSYQTIGRHQKVPQLIPAILAPSIRDASTNISTFFSRQERPLSSLAGHLILIDGVALEERCRYFRSSDSVIGLCREHAGALDLHIQNPQSIIAIEEAVCVEKPRAHFASEATVMAIAPFQSSGYSAVPFALSGSCKAETGEGMAKWVTDMISAWNNHPDGADARGPIWSIATDGEPTMRVCRFTLCMSHKLAVTNPLHSLLQNLTGLNLFTGPDSITMTCDPKHIFKRFATLLRAQEGILVNKSIVNKNHLRSHLVRLPHIDSSLVESLIDPADKQNVPKAVTLIQSLDQLKSLDTSGYNPSEINEHYSLITVGKIFSSFMNPFIDVTMTLSDQLISLSKYTHAAFAVYLKHSTDFMTSALYADSQAVVKDIYFCVAKQKLLNHHADFYIIHCGTDRLETDFCLARTQNHHRNFDILDLAGKLATSSLIDSIYAWNPTLDAGSRRLKVTGVVGVDHLNPKSWIGDVDVSKVSLQLCWEEGRKRAYSLISLLYLGEPVVDFHAVFHLADHDLLRPGGRYVGFLNETDLSIGDDQLDTPTAAPPDLDTPQPTAGAADNSRDNSDGEDNVDNGGDGDNGDSGDLEDLLPDSTDEPLNSCDQSLEDWLEINGQRYLKASLVSQHLKANRSKKVVERMLHVRGLTLDDLRKRPLQTPLDPGGDNFQVGDLVATLIRTESAHIIKTETLHNPKEEYSVQGEVLRILQVSSEMWAWLPHNFLKVSKPRKSGRKKSAVRDYTFSVPGFLCYHVNPGIHPIPHQLYLSDPLSLNPLNDNRTWTFHTHELLDILKLAWSDFQPENDQDLEDKIELLPQVWSSEGFPYADKSGVAAFVVEGFVPDAPNPSKEVKEQCPLCNAPKKLKEMRDHVGCHILLRSRGIEECDLLKTVGGNPCGFCGGDLCRTTLKVTSTKRQVISECRLHCPFKYGSAQKSTKNSPCTNVPINCPHCSETVWKYNAIDHIMLRHKVLLDSASLNPQFILEIQLGKEEETRMGILGEFITSYHTKHPGLFPEGEDLITIEAKAQDTRVNKKRRR
ncbi:hypothetical protein BDM02DRAFT_3194047 [Thelephora ganbajun]|uniref:Uncharacterized protein n=1 Tax=Thelephora ganbajun TaxID=370292 RepID=A0ACB6YY22_THEGA|nr:hypothetical protein BDM02DRAFT_3194047 [Thelephora ganbajun]